MCAAFIGQSGSQDFDPLKVSPMSPDTGQIAIPGTLVVRRSLEARPGYQVCAYHNMSPITGQWCPFPPRRTLAMRHRSQCARLQS